MAVTIRFGRLALALIIPFILCALMSLDRRARLGNRDSEIVEGAVRRQTVDKSAS